MEERLVLTAAGRSAHLINPAETLRTACGRTRHRWIGVVEAGERGLELCRRCAGSEPARAADVAEQWGALTMGATIEALVGTAKEQAPANARGKDGESPEMTIARLRRQQHELGARWGRRVAALQSELDGLRNVVELGRRWRMDHPDYRTKDGKAYYGVHSEQVTGIISALLLELEEARNERDAYRERMNWAVRSQRTLSDSLDRALEYGRDLDARLRSAVRTGLARWEVGTETGADELAERIAQEIRPRGLR